MGWQGTIGKTVAALMRDGTAADAALAKARELGRAAGADVGKRLSVAEADGRLSVEIRKIDDAKRIVVAWASIVSKADGTPIADFDNEKISFDDLEEGFAASFAGGGIGMGDELHDETAKADIIGQITLSRDERVALGFGAGPEGAIVKIKIHDDALWERVRTGELAELSIGGRAVAVEEAA